MMDYHYTPLLNECTLKMAKRWTPPEPAQDHTENFAPVGPDNKQRTHAPSVLHPQLQVLGARCLSQCARANHIFTFRQGLSRGVTGQPEESR